MFNCTYQSKSIFSFNQSLASEPKDIMLWFTGIFPFYHQLHIFLHSTAITCFPLAWYQLHVFLCSDSVACFPYFYRLDGFPWWVRVVCMFFRCWHRLRVHGFACWECVSCFSVISIRCSYLRLSVLGFILYLLLTRLK